MKNNILILSICALIGYIAGYGVADRQPVIESADFKSQEPQTSDAVSFATLPCPSEAVFKKLAASVKLQIPKGDSLDKKCDDGDRAQIAKTLFFMSKIKFNFPQEWPQELKNNLNNSLKFLSDRSKKLAFDLTQVDSLAYNKVQDREIYLGAKLFKLDPYEAVGILVHEARHSDSQANSHVGCEAGDVPRSGGACDSVFSMEDAEAGAYAYGTLFNAGLSLYGINVSSVDREKAMAEALAELGARFNKIPEIYAKKSDVLVILTEDHKIKVVHPQTGETQEIKVKFAEAKEHPVRIEFSPSGNALQIYTSLDRMYQWGPFKKESRLYERLIPLDKKVKDVARTYVPFKEITLNLIRFADNSMFYAEFSPDTKDTALKLYPLNAGRQNNLPTSPFRRHFLALYDETVFLTEEGRLHIAPRFGDQDVFAEPEALKSAHGWIAGTGGVLYDSLFLIDRRGDLGYVGMTLDEVEDHATKIFEVHPSRLQVPEPLKKYAQGLQVHMGLSREGKLYVWSFTDQEGRPRELPLKEKVADFVLTQIVDYEEKIGKQKRAYAPFLGPKDFSKPPYLSGLSN